jgi:hypothetical protein
VAFAAAADDDFAVLEVFKVLLTFFEEVVAAFVAMGDAFAVEIILTEEVFWVEVVFVEVVALLTMSIPSALSAWPAMRG